MSPQELAHVLKSLPQTGKLIKDRSYRQVWRFECAGRPYYLKFYPHGGLRHRLARMLRGSKAVREHTRLQWLQKAGVPAPRAVATLIGLTIEGRKGDAVILEGLEPSVTLDQHLNACALKGVAFPDHRQLVDQVIELVRKLARAGLGHSDLHLGNFLVKDGQVHLLDAYEVHKGGLRLRDIQLLAISADQYITRTDLYRGWKELGPGGPLPPANPRGQSLWRQLVGRIFKQNRYFGQLRIGDWRGHFFKQAKIPQRWSAVSRMKITEKDWLQAWPLLLQQIESDQFEVLKRTASGEVLAGEVILGGRPVAVVVKRPFRKYWYRYFNEIGRGSRPRRAWLKAWELVVRNIPTAWPMLLMEKRCWWYVTDSLMIFERIPSPSLASPVWSARGKRDYHQLLHRVGCLLRRLEQSGLFLYDAKANNWIVDEDPVLGLVPMLVDVDGVRRIHASIGGFNRLLRSLRENAAIGFTREDVLALGRGYSPYANLEQLERLCHLEPALPASSTRREEANRT